MYPCDRMLALKKIESIREDIKYPFPFSNRIRRIIDNAIELFELQPLSLHVRNESQPTLVLERFVADLCMTKFSLIACPAGRENLIGDGGWQCIELTWWDDGVMTRITETGPPHGRFLWLDKVLNLLDGFEVIRRRFDRRGDDEAKSNMFAFDSCFRRKGAFENVERSAKGGVRKWMSGEHWRMHRLGKKFKVATGLFLKEFPNPDHNGNCSALSAAPRWKKKEPNLGRISRNQLAP